MIHLTTTRLDPILEIHDLQTFIWENEIEKAFPVKNNSFMIIWVLEGNGTYLADFKKHAITNDTVYCTCPGQVTVFNYWGSLKGYAILFSSAFLAPLRSFSNLLQNSGLFSLNSKTLINVGIDTKAEMEQLIGSMIKEYNRESELRTEILRTLLKLFLMHLIRNTSNSRGDGLRITGDINLLNQFLDMVEKNFMTMKKVGEYAEKLYMVPNYLNMKIKKATGFTASYHIQQRIILEAKRQVVWDHMSLKEIAYMLGYDNLSHFSKFFKKSVGVSFSNFKRSGYECIM